MTEKMALARADAVAFYPEERMYAARKEWALAWLGRHVLDYRTYNITYLSWEWLA